MKNILYLSILSTVFCCVLISCDANSTVATEENTATETTVTNSLAEFKVFIDQKEVTEKGISEGKITYYSVLDGEGMVAESSTYYTDEEKMMPCLTKIIYKTGGLVSVYWLHDETMWIDKDEYSYIYKKGNLIATLSNNEPAESNDSDKAAVAEIQVLAMGIVTKLLSE